MCRNHFQQTFSINELSYIVQNNNSLIAISLIHNYVNKQLNKPTVAVTLTELIVTYRTLPEYPDNPAIINWLQRLGNCFFTTINKNKINQTKTNTHDQS